MLTVFGLCADLRRGKRHLELGPGRVLSAENLPVEVAQKHIAVQSPQEPQRRPVYQTRFYSETPVGSRRASVLTRHHTPYGIVCGLSPRLLVGDGTAPEWTMQTAEACDRIEDSYRSVRRRAHALASPRCDTRTLIPHSPRQPGNAVRLGLLRMPTESVPSLNEGNVEMVPCCKGRRCVKVVKKDLALIQPERCPITRCLV